MWLLRHGETRYNREGIIQGQLLDSPLTNLGISQAFKYARRIKRSTKGLQDFSIIHSFLGRASQTASIVGDHLGIKKLTPEERLIELNYDLMSGLSKEEAEELFGDMYIARQKDKWSGIAPKNGETYENVFNRVNEWLTNLEEENTIIVTHSVPSKMIRGIILGLGKDEILKLEHDQDTLFLLDWEKRTVKQFKV